MNIMLMYFGSDGDVTDDTLYQRRTCTFSEVENGEVLFIANQHDALYIKGTDHENRDILTNIYNGKSYLCIDIGVNEHTKCLVFKGYFQEDLTPDPDFDWRNWS